MAEKGATQPRVGRPVCSRRSSRVAEKLQQKIRDKEYYEAHQTYRALYQRYKAQGKEGDALDLLYDGALLLLQHGQVSTRGEDERTSRTSVQCCFCGVNSAKRAIYMKKSKLKWGLSQNLQEFALRLQLPNVC